MEKKLKTLQTQASMRCWNSHCNILDVKKKCSGYNQAFYCSQECQKVDWSSHKLMCNFAIKAEKSKKHSIKKQPESKAILVADKEYKELYDKWKMPRTNSIAALADHLLPGDIWKNYFLFWPLLIKERGGNKIVELKMGSWGCFKIYDDSDDEPDIRSMLNTWRQQIINFRESVPEHLKNFRQALIYVTIVDSSPKPGDHRFATLMAIGINAGEVPGTENKKTNQ